MMKKLIVIALLATSSTLMTTGCSSDNEKDLPAPEVTITAAPTAFDLDCQSHTVSVTVESTADWRAAAQDDWATISPSGGLKGTPTTLTINVSANKGMEPRNTNINIVAGTASKTVSLSQEAPDIFEIESPTAYTLSAKQQILGIKVKSNTAWTVTSTDSWLTPVANAGNASGIFEIAVAANDGSDKRQASLRFAWGDGAIVTVEVTQLTDAIDVPDGYALVWNDEFNDDNADLTALWSYDVQPAGWVNHELQRYVAGGLGNEKTAEVHDGMLTLTAKKVGDEIISARLNSKGHWTYGIMEARLRLPKGKGTWPAFWMYPHQANGGWPYCGEIDIMEEVGVVPNEVSSSIHCQSYNHTIGTQKTAARTIDAAEGEFHVYRLEWTEDAIVTYVDGQQLFRFANDKIGDRNTWPFDYDFKIILNLAWGGDWGGMNGVDESALPVSYDIDYVRVFQKL